MNRTSAWNRVGGPWALSLRVAVLAYPVAVVLALFDAGNHGGNRLAWIAVGLAANTLTIAMLIPLRLVLRRATTVRPHPAAAIGAFACAGAVRGTVMGLMAAAIGLMPDAEWGYRQVGGAGTAIVILSALTVAVDAVQSHRERAAALQMETQRIRHIEAGTEARTHALATGVAEELSARLDALTGGERVGDVSELVQEVIADVQADSAGPALPPPRIRPTRIPLRPVLLRALRATAFHPAAVATGVAGLSVAFLVFTLGALRGILAALAMAATPALILWIARAGQRHLPATTTAVLGVALAAALAVVGGCLAAAAVVVAGGISGLTLGLTASVLALAINALAAMAQAATDLQQKADDDLAAALRQRLWAARRASLRVEAVRTDLVRTLHGPVQSALIRAAHALSDPMASSADVVPQARREVVAALAGRDAPSGAATLGLLRDQWEGVVSVGLDITPDAQEVLEHDHAAATAVVEIVREAVTNAARHADAGHCDVSIDHSPDALALLITSPGVLASSRRGLGSQYLDDVCLEWALEQVGTQVALRARVPARTL